MIYSCFDDKSGLYSYFEDKEEHPINADLPVPKFTRTAGEMGVAAIDAGRPLPSGARRVGRGWQARGRIVNCVQRGGLGEMSLTPKGRIGVALACAAIGFAVFIAMRKPG